MGVFQAKTITKVNEFVKSMKLDSDNLRSQSK